MFEPDALDKLMAQQRKATAKSDAIDTDELSIDSTPASPVAPPPTAPTPEDDEYGIGDKERELAEEDAAIAAAEEERIAALKAAEGEREQVMMPPRSLDPEFQNEAISFQQTVLQTVSNMVVEVAKKHGLEGGLKGDPFDPKDNTRMHIMGNLIEMYHINGDVITPEFEQYVLDNWEATNTPAATDTADEKDYHPEEVEKAIDKLEESRSIAPDVQVNITAAPGTPVNVNIDQDLVENAGVDVNVEKMRRIDVVVTEVTEQQLMAAPAIVRNSQKNGIIVPYESETGDVPLALPLSAYRCVLRPVNYYEFMQLGNASTSGNQVDIDKRSWSVIYDHIKNVSIGPFKDFEDFLKKTRYADQQLLLWGILLSAGSVTGEEKDSVTVECPNEKCKEPHVIEYDPYSILHVNEEVAEKLQWKKTQEVAAGPAAVEHYNKMNSTVKRYRIPKRDGSPSKFIVEIEDRPSAYDFLNKRYPLLDELRDRYWHEGMTDRELNNNPEYGYLMIHALYVTAMSIIGDDGKEYRYDQWDDIEKIIRTSLDMYESNVLMQIVQTVASQVNNPIEFYFDGYTCKKCGHEQSRIVIPDIGQSLLFRLARRLQSTQINLIEMQQN